MRQLLLVSLMGALASFASAQITAGQVDTFSANAANWLGASPTWISTGGPLGAGDGFLQLTSTGTFGAGSRMAGYNTAQWSGNYTAAGVVAVEADFRNFSNVTLEMRLTFFDPLLTTQWVSNNSLVLSPTSTWQHVVFSLSPANFTSVGSGSVTFANTIANVNRMMFRHDPAPPSAQGVAVAAVLGIDNVHAMPVPEPSSMAALGLGALLLRRRRR